MWRLAQAGITSASGKLGLHGALWFARRLGEASKVGPDICDLAARFAAQVGLVKAVPASSAAVGGLSLALGVVDFGTVAASSPQPSPRSPAGSETCRSELCTAFSADIVLFGCTGDAALGLAVPLKRPPERLQADGLLAPGLRQAGEGQGAQGGLKTSEFTLIIGMHEETDDLSDRLCSTAVGDERLTSS